MRKIAIILILFQLIGCSPSTLKERIDKLENDVNKLAKNDVIIMKSLRNSQIAVYNKKLIEYIPTIIGVYQIIVLLWRCRENACKCIKTTATYIKTKLNLE